MQYVTNMDLSENSDSPKRKGPFGIFYRFAVFGKDREVDLFSGGYGNILTSGYGNIKIEHEEDSRRRWRKASFFACVLVTRKLEQSYCIL